MDKLFETNSEFHVKKYLTEKVQFRFFRSFLLVLTKFSFLEEDCTLGYNSMNHLGPSWYFVISYHSYSYVMRQLAYSIFITNNHASLYLWWKENLIKHQKVSKHYANYCLQSFILLFISLLTAPFVKNVIFCLEFTFSKKCPKLNVRYHATFKARKFKSLFYNINIFLQKNYNMHWIAGRANIPCRCTIYIYFQFWARFLRSHLLCYFQKFQLLLVKKFRNNFCSIVPPFVWAQKACLRFLKSYFIMKMSIFSSFAVYFLVDMS